MSDSSSLELKHLLRDAKNTIEHLRHDNEILRAGTGGTTSGGSSPLPDSRYQPI